MSLRVPLHCHGVDHNHQNLNLCIPEHSGNVLHLTLHFQVEFVITGIYGKPTPADNHLYLPFSSSHSPSCKRAILYGLQKNDQPLH